MADADETGTRVDYGATAGLEIGRTSSIGLALGADVQHIAGSNARHVIKRGQAFGGGARVGVGAPVV